MAIEITGDGRVVIHTKPKKKENNMQELLEMMARKEKAERHHKKLQGILEKMSPETHIEKLNEYHGKPDYFQPGDLVVQTAHPKRESPCGCNCNCGCGGSGTEARYRLPIQGQPARVEKYDRNGVANEDGSPVRADMVICIWDGEAFISYPVESRFFEKYIVNAPAD